MSSEDITYGEIWEDGDATCLGRITLNGSNITQSVISSIARKIFDLNSSTPTTAINSTTLTVSSAVFDTLQTDGRWTKDSTGYNFRDTIPASIIENTHRYRVEYLFTGSSGEKFFCVYVLVAAEVYSS